MNIEEKLQSLAGRQVAIPDSDGFLNRLHGEIIRKDKIRTEFYSGIFTVALIIVIISGMINNMSPDYDELYMTQFDLDLFSDNDFTYYPKEWLDEEQFAIEVAEYLINEAEFTGQGWELLDDLEDIGLLNIINEELGS